MFFFYRCIVIFLFPIIVLLVLLRVLLNKEDKKRFKEKLFSSSFNFKKNSEKDLIWFHVASIGELKSISALLKNLSKKDNYEILVTTVTLSSSELFKKEFINEKNIKHRFFPIDKPSLVKNFLNNWSPSKIIFVDSEIWPNFLFEINKRNIPLILLNGRITEKTFMRWNLFPTLAKQVFKTFDLCLASSNESKKFLDKLSAKNVKYFGNLKLTVEDELNSRKDNNQKLLSKKQVWCGASIHKGEEVFCIKTHLNLKKNLHQIMTILIPRHTDSVKNIKLTAEKFNLNFQILSAGDQIDMSKEIIIINSYGEISNYLTLCRSVFMGKSMIKKLENVGGQNPIEAARLGCKIYHGPFIYNFQEIYELFNNYNISEKINDENELSKKLIFDFNTEFKNKNEKIQTIKNLGAKILNDTLKELNNVKKYENKQT